MSNGEFGKSVLRIFIRASSSRIRIFSALRRATSYNMNELKIGISEADNITAYRRWEDDRVDVVQIPFNLD